MKKKKIFIWGYYGAQNFGDDLIFNVLFKELKPIQNQYEIYYSVKSLKSAYNINATPIEFFGRKSKFKLLNFVLNIFQFLGTIIKMDAVIIGGGTQYFEIEGRRPVSIFLKEIARKICKIKGKPFINAGVGIGNIYSNVGQKSIKKLFNKASYSFVRDQNSYDSLLSLGVNPKNVTLGKDLSYYDHKENKIKRSETTDKKIGINLFDFYNYIEHNTEKDNEFKKNTILFLKHLQDLNYQINLFALQKDSGGKDFEFLKEISSDINHNFYYYEDDMTSLINKVSEMDINIGMRYHLAVISLQTGVPVIGINYQPKVRREFMLFKTENLVLEMDDILDGKLLNHFDYVDENIQDFKNQLGKNLKVVMSQVDSTTIKKVSETILDGNR